MWYWEKHRYTLWSDDINIIKSRPNHQTSFRKQQTQQSTFWHAPVSLGALWTFNTFVVRFFCHRQDSFHQWVRAYFSFVAKANTHSANDCLPSIHFSITVCVCVCYSFLEFFGWTTAERKLNSPQLYPQEDLTVAPLIDCPSFQICCTLRRGFDAHFKL